MQSLGQREDKWTPPIVKAVATECTGVTELMGAIREYESFMRGQNLLVSRRKHNWELRLLEMLRDSLLEKARAAISEAELTRLASDIAEHKRDPYSVIEEIEARVRS